MIYGDGDGHVEEVGELCDKDRPQLRTDFHVGSAPVVGAIYGDLLRQCRLITEYRTEGKVKRRGKQYWQQRWTSFFFEGDSWEEVVSNMKDPNHELGKRLANLYDCILWIRANRKKYKDFRKAAGIKVQSKD